MQGSIGIETGMGTSPAQPAFDAQTLQPVDEQAVLRRDHVIEAIPADGIGLASYR